MYAKNSEVKAGTILIADDGFTCLHDGAERTVESDDDGLFIPCAAGKHYLDGQLNENDEYVGLTIKAEA